jgi:hypothetical protein
MVTFSDLTKQTNRQSNKQTVKQINLLNKDLLPQAQYFVIINLCFYSVKI